MTTDAPPRRLRLALVCDWYLPRVGGIERHLSQLASHLAASHEVTVITPTRGPDAGDDGRVHRLPGSLLPFANLMWTPASFHRLGAELHSRRFDLVHAHSSLISPAAYAAVYHAQAAGLPVALTVHSVWGNFRRLFNTLDRATGWTRWPVAFSAVSARVARDISPLLHGAPVDVVPNAIDPADWPPAVAPAATAPFTIVSVMRLAPRKRGAALLRIFREARTRHPQLRLEIIGDGPERGKLVRLARQLRLGDAVHFHGTLDRAAVRASLARSHAFLLSSEHEAFGLAALEARATGLPVVALRTGGVGEWLEDGVSGLLADDDAGLAQHLVALAGDPGLHRRLADHNRATPVRFTWENSLAAHDLLYTRARALAGR